MNAKGIGFAAAGLVVLAGLFIWMRPPPEPVPPPATKASGIAAAPARPKPVEVAVELRLEGGQRVSGPERISAQQGEVLRLRVTSDVKDELHIHGYDFTADLAPDDPVELRFPLTQAGRFEIELHHAHAVVTVLEVHPKG